MASSNPLANSKKQKAFKLLNQGRVQEAVQILEQIVNKYPKDVEALATLGSVYGQSGQLEPAVHYLEQVVAINPKNLEALSNLGVANMMLGNKEMAAEYIERVVKLQPNDVGALYNLACIRQEQGNLELAIDYFQRVIQRQPKAIDAMVNLGVALKDIGQGDESLDIFRQAVKLDPTSAEANLNLAQLLARSGNKDEAIEYYEQAASSAPGDYDKIRALATMRIIQGKPDEAITIFENALAHNNRDAKIYREYARILLSIGRTPEAVDSINKALEISPEDVDGLLVRAHVYKEISAHKLAIKDLESALTIEDDNVDIILALVALYSIGNELDKTKACLDIAKRLSPKSIAVTTAEIDFLLTGGMYDDAIELLKPLLELPNKTYPVGNKFAKLCKHMSRCHEAIDYLTDVLNDFSDSVPVNVRRDAMFELGRLYDGLKQPNKAFDLFQQANALKSSNFSCAEHHQYVDSLQAVFSCAEMEHGHHASIESESPVFIVGMPRSGTSLTEQIIASHHATYGAGELNTIAQTYRDIERLMRQRASCGELLELSVEDCDHFARIYLDELRSYSDTAIRITDKMPTNFLYLGLIQQLFPKTRIIHTLRNPLDVCLSIYSLDFAGDHPYSYNLHNLGCFYNEYRRIMRHWHTVLDIPIMDIQYEDLVNDQEAWSRKLIDFCGLEWDENCLQFHKSKRAVITASNQQVRQPIYKGSMQRWRPYEKHLQPLIDALEPEYRREAGVENWDY